jgi:hypothetical protein
MGREARKEGGEKREREGRKGGGREEKKDRGKSGKRKEITEPNKDQGFEHFSTSVVASLGQFCLFLSHSLVGLTDTL